MSDATGDIASANEQLRATGLSDEVLALLEFQPGELGPLAFRMVLKDHFSDKYIAIENQNFSPMILVCKQVGSLLLAGSFPLWAPGAVISLIFELYAFHKHSIELSAEEGAVVLKLKESGGMSLATLAQVLGFDEPKTQAILDAIGDDKTRRDGVPVKLVVRDASGQWTAPNI